jgi:hypothetical protein
VGYVSLKSWEGDLRMTSRNAPCPCGSGKKYKKCCGLTSDDKKLCDTSKKATSTVSRERTSARLPTALPGLQYHVVVRHCYQDPHDFRNLGGPKGLPGEYRVIFTLNRPGFPLKPEREFSFGLNGDSHLAITKPAYINPLNPEAVGINIYFEGNKEQMKFTGYPNEKGFLGKIELPTIEANDFTDAWMIAYGAVAPWFSIISLYFDIPMSIYQSELTEIRTQSVRINILDPFVDTPLFQVPYEEITEEFRKYASLYREALNSNSPNYQFLCYYKIIEGIRKRRERLFREDRDKGQEIPRYSQIKIPENRDEQQQLLGTAFPLRKVWDDFALDTIFLKESRGKKVNRVIDSELRDIRKKIAHAVLDPEEPTISIDIGQDVEKVEKWLPLTKFIARFFTITDFANLMKRN